MASQNRLVKVENEDNLYIDKALLSSNGNTAEYISCVDGFIYEVYNQRAKRRLVNPDKVYIQQDEDNVSESS